MFGFLNINKPAGKTSRDAVNQIQRWVRPTKVGHGGTLDPLATGVLVIALGPATRLIEYVQAQPKTYRGSFRLGQSSNTEDLEGEITVLQQPPLPTLEEITQVLPEFTGPIQQVPPAYSAVKINGQRAYKLARQGSDPQLSARTVEIFGLNILSYDYPNLELEIQCGSGTYIRSLGRDLARALGTEAVMTSLTRTAIGEFSLETAMELDVIQGDQIASSLLAPAQGLHQHPGLELDAESLRQLQNGRPLLLDRFAADETAPHLLAFDHDHRLQAVLKPTTRGWRVAKSFWDAHSTPPIKNPYPTR